MELENLKESLSSLLNEKGYDLYSLSYKKEGRDMVLSIVVDRVMPISMNDIEEVTNLISSYLDEIDAFANPYMLDISSLGAEKPLKIENLPKYIGKKVNVHFINPIKGENIYEGILVEVDENNISLDIKVKTRTIRVTSEVKNIAKIRLAV